MFHLSYFCLLSIAFTSKKLFPSTFTPGGFLVGGLFDWLFSWFGFSLEWLRHLVVLGSPLALQSEALERRFGALGQDWLTS